MFPDFNHYLLLVEKILFVIGAITYLIFAIIIVKQTTVMTKNINDKFNPILIAFSYIHLLFSVSLVLLTLVLL